MKHELKTWPVYFQATWAGAKFFEIRKNDRDFKINDEIVLKEFIPENGADGEYTGREIEGFIRYVTGDLCKEGYVTFSFDETHRQE